MEKRIREIISENSGVTGVLLRDSVGKTITINEEVVFPSASLIKLFILMTLNKEDYNKKIELKKEDKVGGCGILKVMGDGLSLTVKDIAYLMICLSDNTATNILIDYIGMDKINSCIKIKYITQLPNTQVPSFVYFANLPQYVKEPYRRFLENKMREKWKLTGTPINIYIRQK